MNQAHRCVMSLVFLSAAGAAVCLLATAAATVHAAAVYVSGPAPGVAVSPSRLIFTPANWARPQVLTVAGGDAPTVRFAIEDFGLDATVKLGRLDPLEGAKLNFRTIP